MGNSLSDMIQLTGDCPSENESGKMPLLNTQEVVRIRRNISLELPWEITVKHLNDFSQRMGASGYDKKYRFEIIKSGVEGFDKMVAEENQGGRPINQRRTGNEDKRQKKKELQKKHRKNCECCPVSQLIVK